MTAFIVKGAFVMQDNMDGRGYRSHLPIEMHHLVRPVVNNLHCRIQVQSQLKMLVWKEFLNGYLGTQLMHLLEFGFFLEFNESSHLNCDHKNHKSV